jgi:hypothetical protein
MNHPPELFRFLALCQVQRCLQLRCDGAERAGPPNIRSDFRYAAAEIERVRGQIIILPVQNSAACAERFCQTDGHSRTLRVGFCDDEWLGEEVWQLASLEVTFAPKPEVSSNQTSAVCEDLRPAQNANRVPQSSWPKWILLHERVDHVRTIGFNDPQPTGRIT